jgi:hypothetical protein
MMMGVRCVRRLKLSEETRNIGRGDRHHAFDGRPKVRGRGAVSTYRVNKTHGAVHGVKGSGKAFRVGGARRRL